MTGLEALEYLKENKRKHWLDDDKSTECLDAIETALKRLEIISNKRVDIDLLLWSDNVEYYNKYCSKYINVETQLTQEEYDLLKEILL